MPTEISSFEALPPDCSSHVFERLKLRDLGRLAQLSSRVLVATGADAVWDEKWRQRWPQIGMPTTAAAGEPLVSHPSRLQQTSRQAYFDRHSATQQMEFEDRHTSCCWLDAEGEPRLETPHEDGDLQGRERGRRRLHDVPVEQLTSVSGCEPLEYDFARDPHLFAAVQGSNVSVWSMPRKGDLQRVQVYRGHTGRVTRLLPLRVTQDFQLFRQGLQPMGIMNVEEPGSSYCLLSASKDRTIKLWGKNDKPLRTFCGHTADVLCISDATLDISSSQTVCFASGSVDGTVRIWSLFAPGKGKSPCLATLVGHVAPVTWLSVPREGPLGLVSVDSAGKVQFWDSFLSASFNINLQDFCAGSSKGPAQPLSVKTNDSLCIITSKQKIVGYDLRSLQQAWTLSAGAGLSFSAFSLSPRGDAFWCGGDHGEVFFCDARILPQTLCGSDVPSSAVNYLFNDSFKAVSASPSSPTVQVWDALSGNEVVEHSLCPEGMDPDATKLTGLAASGSLLMFATFGAEGCQVGCSSFEDSVVRTAGKSHCTGKTKFWSEALLES